MNNVDKEDYNCYRDIIIKALNADRYTLEDIKKIMSILILTDSPEQQPVNLNKKKEKTCKMCNFTGDSEEKFIANRKICKTCFALNNKTYYKETHIKWVKKNKSST